MKIMPRSFFNEINLGKLGKYPVIIGKCSGDWPVSAFLLKVLIENCPN